MWLLNVETRTLENFADDRTVRGQYAILSHTWGEGEVTFDEIHLEGAQQKRGYRKIDFTCKQAAKEGLRYAWIDTCCIDKRSSAELSEAINSMFRWYYHSKVCYAYLDNFAIIGPWYNRFNPLDGSEERFKACRWFTRTWTLQELIAPARVSFWDMMWRPIGTKDTLQALISTITGIDQGILADRSQLGSTSVAKRMSFAAARQTTRQEDGAYSLLGIFNVNMPLLYGEGQNAFVRLQETIIRTFTRVDHSILLWRAQGDVSSNTRDSLLAPSASCFRHCRNVASWPILSSDVFDLTNQGLRMTCNVFEQPDGGVSETNDVKVLLNCKEKVYRVGLRLRPHPLISRGYVADGSPAFTEQSYDVSNGLWPLYVLDTGKRTRRANVFLSRDPFSWPLKQPTCAIVLERPLKPIGAPFDPQGLRIELRHLKLCSDPTYIGFTRIGLFSDHDSLISGRRSFIYFRLIARNSTAPLLWAATSPDQATDDTSVLHQDFHEMPLGAPTIIPSAQLPLILQASLVEEVGEIICKIHVQKDTTATTANDQEGSK